MLNVIMTFGIDRFRFTIGVKTRAPGVYSRRPFMQEHFPYSVIVVR